MSPWPVSIRLHAGNSSSSSWKLSADGDRAIMFSSHIVSDIERLANRIWILKEGRLDWQGDLDSLKESIVRLHVRGAQRAIASLAVPGALSLRRDAAFADRRGARLDAASGSARSKKGRRSAWKSETLGLEEIFLELHR